ncbi:MAG: ABC transporter substrate-binding protein, partial [Lachnospiraceae bacterium]|nr:ABC transporter substrate-binding protein [Lachnospiraceae bacterium]
MALTLAACGGTAPAPAAETPAAPAAEAPAAETPAAETPAATAETPAAAAETVKEDAGATGDVISVGFAQVGHESDWRTAATGSVQDAFSAENGFDLQFVDCDNDSAAQLEAVRTFIQSGVDYIVIDPIVST